MIKDKVLIAAVLVSLLGSHFTFAQDQKAIYSMTDAQIVAARVTYDYKPDSLYRVDTQLGFVSDIELKPGETVTYIVGGDTQRWLIDKAKVANVVHVYIKPLAPNISTNIIIDTNLHAYRLDLHSGNTYNPLITFNFPDEAFSVSGSKYNSDASWIQNLKKSDWDMKLWGKELNYKYDVKNKDKVDPVLVPLEIMDDGVRTYIKMPKNNKYDLPVLYNVDVLDKKQKLSLINYRVINQFFVADRVFVHGKLYYNNKFSIDFYNKQKVVPEESRFFKRTDTSSGTRLRPDNKKSFLQNLVYDYQVKNVGVNDKDLPQDVAQDGARTYIQMKHVDFNQMPALYDVDSTGALKFVTYTIAGKFFIVDHVIKHGKLFYSPKLFAEVSRKGD